MNKMPALAVMTPAAIHIAEIPVPQQPGSHHPSLPRNVFREHGFP
jgi:hypothetical protein